MKFFIWLLFCSVLPACSTSSSVNLKKISLGDNKGAVLHQLGSPLRSYYKEETQRWVYKVRDENNGLVEKEVWFKDARVVYADAPFLLKQPPSEKKTIEYTPIE